MMTAPWSPECIKATMAQGPHKSAFEYVEFVGEELGKFVLKGQWIILLFDVIYGHYLIT
jgi:hypothetical protein